jgi:GNAT superfamily N-acetyltransferase
MPADITTRDAEPADIVALTGLMNELGYPTSAHDMVKRMAAIFAHPDYKTIVAVLNNEVVGMAGLYKGLHYEKNGSYMRITAFVVRHDQRNLGIGKLLIIAAEEWAVTQGINAVVISSRNSEERRAAHALYQKMGYSNKSAGFFKQL